MYTALTNYALLHRFKKPRLSSVVFLYCLKDLSSTPARHSRLVVRKVNTLSQCAILI